MQQIGIALLMMVCLWPSLSLAKPLLVRWPPYTPNNVPVERLVVYRAIGTTGTLQPYAVVSDLKATAYVDNRVTPQTRYCYALRVITAGEVASPITARACATPVP